MDDLDKDLSIEVLYTESTPRVFPFNGAIDTGDLASATFQTTGKPVASK